MNVFVTVQLGVGEKLALPLDEAVKTVLETLGGDSEDGDLCTITVSMPPETATVGAPGPTIQPDAAKE